MKIPGMAAALLLALTALAAGADEPRRLTVLFDAFGAPSPLKKHWGYAALIEYGGRRILFDTGNHAQAFEHNVRTLGVDLTRLDAVVISHRHGDHTTGLDFLLTQNPKVKIYVPQDITFKGTVPAGFFTGHPGLPPEQAYFEGKPPPALPTGSQWPEANFEVVTKPTEILPGFFVLTTLSRKPGTLEMNEVSLAIRTPRGLAVVVGCSHPGVELILAEAAKIDPRIHTVTGGLHLVLTPPAEIERVATVLHDELKLERVAPGHCTSELGFVVFRKKFGERFDHAGLGTMLALP